MLIYVVIHANPPQLASQLEFVQRFRMHSRMVSEAAYFFTQLVRFFGTRFDVWLWFLDCVRLREGALCI